MPPCLIYVALFLDGWREDWGCQARCRSKKGARSSQTALDMWILCDEPRTRISKMALAESDPADRPNT